MKILYQLNQIHFRIFMNIGLCLYQSLPPSIPNGIRMADQREKLKYFTCGHMGLFKQPRIIEQGLRNIAIRTGIFYTLYYALHSIVVSFMVYYSFYISGSETLITDFT